MRREGGGSTLLPDGGIVVGATSTSVSKHSMRLCSSWSLLYNICNRGVKDRSHDGTALLAHDRNARVCDEVRHTVAAPNQDLLQRRDLRQINEQ